MLSQKFKNIAKLSRNDLKNVTGGNDQGKTGSYCPVKCDDVDHTNAEGSGKSCPANMRCQWEFCGENTLTSRCVAVY
ncbi:hypothetical protein [Pedobacter sp. FW305-3-2-15-E-R2A2]|jgi:hypothetical protein|uniref:hypothetical protein n=1 Tax=Pedobacter sp. FW305-3-2-15-E-R2A2 TaxID=3140251 RepID=UPI0031407201